MSVWTSSVGRGGSFVAESGNRACCRESFTSNVIPQYPEQIPKDQEAETMRTKLSDVEIQAALKSLPGWGVESGAIVKTYKFGKFAEGIAFVGRVAVAADAMDHHPDIDIRYTKIRV